MGTIQHHAMVVTAQDEDILPAHASALSIFKGTPAEVSPVSSWGINGHRSFAVFLDGSKEGWEGSNVGDDARERFRAWLSSFGRCRWVEVTYGEESYELVDSDRRSVHGR